MPSQETKWYKDQRLVALLDDMRKRNMEFMGKCYFCDNKSSEIKAIKEKLYAVCSDHE